MSVFNETDKLIKKFVKEAEDFMEKEKEKPLNKLIEDVKRLESENCDDIAFALAEASGYLDGVLDDDLTDEIDEWFMGLPEDQQEFLHTKNIMNI